MRVGNISNPAVIAGLEARQQKQKTTETEQAASIGGAADLRKRLTELQDSLKDASPAECVPILQHWNFKDAAELASAIAEIDVPSEARQATSQAEQIHIAPGNAERIATNSAFFACVMRRMCANGKGPNMPWKARGALVVNAVFHKYVKYKVKTRDLDQYRTNWQKALQYHATEQDFGNKYAPQLKIISWAAATW